MNSHSIFIAALLVSLFFVGSLTAQPLDFEHSNLSFYRDKANAKQRILNRQHWERRREQILNGMQAAMGPFPKSRSRKFTATEISRSQPDDAFEVQTIRLEDDSPSSVVADLYVPKNAKLQRDKLPAILALHPTGAPGKRLIGGKNPKQNRQYANELAQRGYVVIAPDYPSFGDLKEHNFDTDGHPSGTMQGILNHMRCVDYLESLDFVDPQRIGVMGHSLGGHNAIFVAVFDQRIKAVVSSCGWTPFHDYYNGKIAGWTSQRYMPRLKTRYQLNPDQVPFDFYELVAALAPRPFYSNSPLQDSNFAVTGVKKAVAKATQIYTLYGAADRIQAVYPKCGHDFPSEIRDESYRMLDKTFGHQPLVSVGFGAELPRIHPLPPDKALGSFNNRNLQLAASEPLVQDPIAMSFDEHQKLFVIEMQDYSEQDREFLGQVRMLEDQNHDGVFEKSTIFARELSWPTAILCYGGGVFVAAAPDIWFLKDTNGDGQADLRKKVITGFGRGNVQGLMNCLRWGLDNRIHGATSSSGGTVHPVGKPPETGVNLRGGDFSFDPKTLSIRRESGGAQHGMCFDDFGQKYVCSNSDHAQAILYDERYLSRNPYAKYTRARKSIAVDGGQAPVYRSSPVEPWRVVRTRLRVAGRVPGPVEGGGTAAGYFTGSTGITIYRGDAGSVDKGIAIIGDVGSNIVHRKRIFKNGLDIAAKRIDLSSELITSIDNWFRPVQFGHGPDGCLYILDMYREVIEHPKSLPPMIKRHLDLTEGRDRGRIYRLGNPKLNRKNDLAAEMSATDLVPFLNHPNSWHRETAARLIFEKQDPTCVPALQNVRVNGFGTIGKIHALWALHGLRALKFDDLVTAIRDADPEVRKQAILLAEKSKTDWLNRPSVQKLANDPSIDVRLQLAFSVGDLPTEQRLPALWRLMRQSNGHALMTTALMSSANGLQIQLLRKLALAKSQTNSGIWKDLVSSLLQQIAARNRTDDLQSLSTLVLEQIENGQEQVAIELLLAMNLANRRYVQKLLDQPQIANWFSQWKLVALKQAASVDATISARIGSLNGLALAGDPESLDQILQLVVIDQPLEIQLAAIRNLGLSDSMKVAESLIQKKERVGQRASTEIQQQLLGKLAWTRLLLEKSQTGDLTIAQLQLLSRSSDPTIKKLAQQKSAEFSTAGTSQLINSYRKSLEILGDAGRGQAIFEKNCSGCHRAGGIGFEIGPNLATMKSRGKEAVLINVLDPNREVNPAFVNYLVETTDGRSVSGMIVNETSGSITLQQEKKKENELLKSEIENIKNTGMSLMPAGFEKEISVESMADLLEFLINTQ